MQHSPVKPYLAIGAIVLVSIAILLSWKGGFFVALEQDVSTENTPPKPIPATISGIVIVIEKDAQGSKIVLDSEGHKITGIVTEKTKFARTAELAPGLNMYTRKRALAEDVIAGEKVEFIPVRSSIEENQESFQLLLVTILQR